MLRIRTGRAVGHMIPIERLAVADDTLLVRRVILRMDGEMERADTITTGCIVYRLCDMGGGSEDLPVPCVRFAGTDSNRSNSSRMRSPAGLEISFLSFFICASV